jgi:DNA-damage-inducible protein D
MVIFSTEEAKGRPMSETELAVFHFEKGKTSFEDLGIQNGARTWKEADLMQALGYAESGSFRKAITRAMQACLSLGIPTEENFLLVEGAYKLTRFACYLVAMNADSKKPQVAAALMYFAAIAETFATVIEHADGIERIAIRDEMSDGMKSLGGTAKAHGVTNYAFFQNAGYRGMYNMDLARVSSFKGLPHGEKLLDRMGKVELAANLFRITQTEERIKNKNLRGQVQLESAAHGVGREVRKIMIDNTGSAPEHLGLAQPIKDVKKVIKTTSKRFRELDSKKKP